MRNYTKLGKATLLLSLFPILFTAGCSSGERTSLSSSVLSDLKADLSGASASSISSKIFSALDIQNRDGEINVLAIILSDEQISQIIQGATNALQRESTQNSVDLVNILPVIAKGATAVLDEIGVTEASDRIQILRVIGQSLVESLNGRQTYLPFGSANNGSTAFNTAINKLANAFVSNLGSAGISAADANSAINGIVQSIIATLDSSGISEPELTSGIQSIVSGSTTGLGNLQISGFDPSSIPDAVQAIAAGATSALNDINMNGFNSSDIAGIITQISSGITKSLAQITGPNGSFDPANAIKAIGTGIGVGAQDISATFPGIINQENLESWIESGANSAGTNYAIPDIGTDIGTGLTLPNPYTGSPNAVLSFADGSTYNFGTLVEDEDTGYENYIKTFTITNTGSVAATDVSAILRDENGEDTQFFGAYMFLHDDSSGGGGEGETIFSGPPSYPGFGGTCGETLEPGQSCTVVVIPNQFNSETGENYANGGSLAFSYNNGSSVTTSAINLTVQFPLPPPEPQFFISSSHVKFFNTQSQTATLTVLNSGNGNGYFDPANLPMIQQSPGVNQNPVYFTFGGGLPFPGSGGTCSGTLAPDATCTFTVTFNPGALAQGESVSNYYMSLTYSPPGAEQTYQTFINLSGTVPNRAWLEADAQAENPHIRIPYPDATTWISQDVVISNNGPLTATDIAVQFGGFYNQAGGAHWFTSNPLITPATYANQTDPGYPGHVAGGGPAACGTTLASGASCRISVSPKPDSSLGWYDTLSLTYGSGGSGQNWLNMTFSTQQPEEDSGED